MSSLPQGGQALAAAICAPVWFRRAFTACPAIASRAHRGRRGRVSQAVRQSARRSRTEYGVRATQQRAGSRRF
jgi:hypothetical protein